jgi:hypothetical protein
VVETQELEATLKTDQERLLALDKTLPTYYEEYENFSAIERQHLGITVVHKVIEPPVPQPGWVRRSI